MDDNQRLDWLTTVGSEFSQVLGGVVNPEFLDPHEATEPLWEILGTEFSPDTLQDLSDSVVARLVAEFNRYFETDQVTASHIRDAVASTLARWK